MLSHKEREYLCDKYGLTYPHTNALVNHVMTRIRLDRALLSPTYTHSVVHVGDMARIWLHTPACRFSQQGSCTICNYWSGRKTERLMERVLPQIRLPEGTRSILVNTCGSCLDPAELTVAEQNQLLQWIDGQKVQAVILETHRHTLTEETVKRVCGSLKNVEVMFEIGQESLNPDVLFFCLNKPTVQAALQSTIERIHLWGAKCIFNVILGAPMLSPREQVADAVYSINHLLAQGADFVTLFPVNIKPHTLPDYLYRIGQFEAIRIELLVDVLLQVPEADLPRVDVAWYGEFVEEGVIAPRYPEHNGKTIFQLLGDYNNSANSRDRRLILEKIKGLRAESDPEPVDGEGFAQRIERIYDLLSEKYEYKRGERNGQAAYGSASSHE